MLIIRTKGGIEVRVPVDELESVTEVEPATGAEKRVPAHPYIHREGIERCAACWKGRAHPSHTGAAAYR